MGMFGYMTDTETVEPTGTVEVESEGKNSLFSTDLRNHVIHHYD